nr:MAG TPA: hypothetical protein [Caudoviricetes sp.]
MAAHSRPVSYIKKKKIVQWFRTPGLRKARRWGLESPLFLFLFFGFARLATYIMERGT